MLFAAVVVIVAGITAWIARATKTPHPFGLVLAGLALGWAGESWPRIAPSFGLTHEALFSVLLPPLLFEAAYALPAPELKKYWAPATLLAGPGVVVGAALATLGAWWILHALHDDATFTTLAILGAVTAATDPVAVVAVLRQSGAPSSLRTLLDVESLLNDGVAVVVLAAVLEATSGHAGWPAIAIDADWAIAGGLAIGWAVGAAGGRLAKIPWLGVPVSLGVAYGAFRAADVVHASGILAVLAAGVVVSRHAGRPRGMRRAWDAIAFAANSVVFLLVGLAIDPGRVRADAIAVGVVWVTLLLVRWVLVEGALLATRERSFRGWKRAALTLGGLRGGLSVALALEVGNPRVIDLTSGVVLLTILAQGGLIFAARRRLG